MALGDEVGRNDALAAQPAPWLARDRLITRLDEVADAGGVAILAAEAGTGKTVLIRQWLMERNISQSLCIQADAAVAQSVAEAMTSLRAGAGQTVVVDRTEQLSERQLLALGEAVVARAPQTAVVLSGRHDPGLCLDEVRATGPVLELDGRDLAWTGAEVGNALQRWCETPIAASDVELIAWQTEGWCAAVRLAALAGPGAVGARGVGLHRHLLDELTADVGAELRAEIMTLALADEFDAALVDAVLAPAGGGASYIDRLVRQRLFVRPGSAPGRWRFLRPFRDAARHAVAALVPATTAARRGRLAEHLIAAGSPLVPMPDPDRGLLTDDLLAAHAVQLLLAGRLVAPVPAELDALPTSTPLGRVAAAVALLAAGDRELAEVVLGAPEPLPLPHHAELLAVLELLWCRHRGDLDATARAATTLAAGSGDDGLAALAWLELGLLEQDLGAWSAADEHLRLAASCAERAQCPTITASARSARAELAALTGRLREADELTAALQDDPCATAEAAVRTYVARSVVAFLRDEIDRALGYAEEARARAGVTRDPMLWVSVLLVEVAALEALGRDVPAFERLAEARAMVDRCPVRPFRGLLVDLFHIRLLQRAGRADAVGGVLSGLDEQELEALELVVARRALSAGDSDAAIAALRPRLSDRSDQLAILGVWHLLTYAIAADRLGDADTAHDALEQALALAEPDGMRRPFSDEGLRSRPLLEAHVERDTAHAGFALELLDRIGGARPAPDAGLRSPLTARERAVLGYLTTSMTAGEIGRHLTVSETTVRTHVRHIYEKLDVTTRATAIARARELGLLAPELAR